MGNLPNSLFHRILELAGTKKNIIMTTPVGLGRGAQGWGGHIYLGRAVSKEGV